MRLRTARHTVTDEDLRSIIMYPLVQCKAEPLAEIHVPKFDELRLDWDTVHAAKLALDDKESEAQARINNASAGMSRVAGCLSKAILTITGDKRTAALYTCYFDTKPLSVFKRTFTVKRERMAGWVKTLKESEHPTLAALAPEVEQAVAAADAAVKMRADVKNEKRAFRDVGDRRKLVEKTNAVCKAVHGELSALPHKVPGLPLDFADRFFLSEARDRDDEGGEDEDPVEAARALVEARKEDLAEAEAHLKKVEADRDAAAATAAAIAEEKAKIAAIEAEVADKSKLASALKAKLSSSRSAPEPNEAPSPRAPASPISAHRNSL
jgi:hypothetical protein